MTDGVGKGIRSMGSSSPSCLNKVGVKVGDWAAGEAGLGDTLRDPRTSADNWMTCWFRRLFSTSICDRRDRRNWFCCSIWIFSFSSFSISSLLRSREVWAAARLRRTRSIRRCSFSSSVLARFLVFVSELFLCFCCLEWNIPRRQVRLGGWEFLAP